MENHKFLIRQSDRSVKHLLLPAFFLSFLYVITSSSAFSQTDQGWKAPAAIVEKLSVQGPSINYKEEKVPSYTLPGVLKPGDVTINSAEQWNKSGRPAILELFRKNVFGRVPETSYSENFKTSAETISQGIGATQKNVEIVITSGGKSLTIHLTLFTPNNSGKPVPTFLLIDNRFSGDWKDRGEFFPVGEALRRGYGMAVFSNSDLDPDDFDNFRNGIHGLLDKNPRPADAWGTLAAWAWGASRCMDYLITDKDVDHKRIAIVGHSRGGKTALWAGAQDTRFSMVISNESGAGGAALARRRFGETVERLNTGFPHWFCSNYKLFNNNENAMPVDMHMLLALVAPRALYVDCADEDLWGDPKGSYLSLYNAVPVYKLLGQISDIPESIPPLEKQLISGKVGFHIRGGSHNLLLKDWNRFMDFADIIWK